MRIPRATGYVVQRIRRPEGGHHVRAVAFSHATARDVKRSTDGELRRYLPRRRRGDVLTVEDRTS